MMKNKKNEEQFYGTTTLGEKGQAVIPVEAREAMGIKKGEKLLVFGMGRDMIVFTKLSHVEKRLQAIRTVIRKTKS